MKDSELLAEVKAAEELVKRGYTRSICPACEGSGSLNLKYGYVAGIYQSCQHCSGRGFVWMSPMTKGSKTDTAPIDCTSKFTATERYIPSDTDSFSKPPWVPIDPKAVQFVPAPCSIKPPK
jgi:Excinuclease ATPase subunit